MRQPGADLPTRAQLNHVGIEGALAVDRGTGNRLRQSALLAAARIPPDGRSCTRTDCERSTGGPITLGAAMERLLVLVLLALPTLGFPGEQARSAHATTPVVRYGANTSAGGNITHDGVKLYHEIYGTGEPLLLVHDNGESIGTLSAQIA
jgi:hypothetical protein